MARPQLQAKFFVRPDGVCIPKAPPLSNSYRFDLFHKRQGRKCRICRAPLKFFRVHVNVFCRGEYRQANLDHIVPRARGGQNDPRNLRWLCDSCNLAKGAD